MEEKKRGHGRPRLDVPNGRCSRRQAVNSMYVNKAAQLISEADIQKICLPCAQRKPTM